MDYYCFITVRSSSSRIKKKCFLDLQKKATDHFNGNHCRKYYRSKRKGGLRGGSNERVPYDESDESGFKIEHVLAIMVYTCFTVCFCF